MSAAQIDAWAEDGGSGRTAHEMRAARGDGGVPLPAPTSDFVTVRKTENLADRECSPDEGGARELRNKLPMLNCLALRLSAKVKLCGGLPCKFSGRQERVREKAPERSVGLSFYRSSEGLACSNSYVSPRPAAEFRLARADLPSQLKVRTRIGSGADAVYVRTPDGRWFCDSVQALRDEPGAVKDGCMAVNVRGPTEGTYRVWIGARVASGEHAFPSHDALDVEVYLQR